MRKRRENISAVKEKKLKKNITNSELLEFLFDPQNEDEETLDEYFKETGADIEAEEQEFKDLIRVKILNAQAEETKKLNEIYFEEKSIECSEEIEAAAMAYRNSELKKGEEEKIFERDKEKLAKVKKIKEKRDK